jgi:hemerythrin superfamily protein
MLAAITAFIESVDAIDFLHADHERIRRLFGEFERLLQAGAKDEAEELARCICREVTLHATVEEEIFYPEARAAIADANLVREARVEHALVKYLIEQILKSSIADEKFTARVRVLGACMLRHMREEDDIMFVRARATGLDMHEIGSRIAARKHDLQTEMDLLEEGRGPRRRRTGFANRTAQRWRLAS